jgi:hypothetical protein
MMGGAMVLRFFLRLHRRRLERRIAERFDTELSRKIDALVMAEEAVRGVMRRGERA